MRITRRASSVAIICALVVSAGTATPAEAATAGEIAQGIFGAVMGTIREGRARGEWQKVDGDVRTCLSSRINISIDQLVQKDIWPADPRLSSHLQACEQKVTEARERLQAQREWQEVDNQVMACLSDSTNTDINQLIQDAISPSDPQINLYIQTCKQEIADARIRLEQEQYAAEERRRAMRAAKEADRARKNAKHRKLVAKYGAEMTSAIEAGEIKFGMPKDAVIAATGKPKHRESIPPSDELWYYGAKRVSFTDGKVTYVGH